MLAETVEPGQRKDKSMKHLALGTAIIGILVSGAALATPAAPLVKAAPRMQQQVHIVPNEITYDIELARAAERSGMLIASGRLFSRLEGGPCEGWSSTSRMKVRFVFRREATRETESRVASWESDDGNRFYSRIERFLNGLPVETVQVRVERERAGQPYRLEMTAPERRREKLPPDTLFPTAALKQLLLAARAGERQRTLLLYEGDEDAAPQHVVALIGRKHAPLTTASDNGATPREGGGTKQDRNDLALLEQMPYWPVSLAYYGTIVRKDGSQATDKEKEASSFGLPEYEVHFRLYENGVTGEALLIYPNYVLRAHPVHLKLLAPARCQ